jgi:hypothetical protein
MKTAKKNLLQWICLICLFTSVIFLVLWPVGFRYYSTVGIDRDRRDSDASVCCRYYRVRWPGDGSLHIGGGVSHYRFGSKAVEPFDWGGRFFQAPRRDVPRSFFNRLGFWWIQKQYDDAWTVKDASLTKPSELWIGVPGFLPGILFAFLFLLCRRRIASDKINVGQKSKNSTASNER